MRKNVLRELIQEGKPTLGTHANLDNPTIVELIGHSGMFDYVEFVAEYGPVGPAERAAPGSLTAWLTERYCLYVLDPRGQVFRAEIHHQPWPLHPAAADITRNTMIEGLGFALDGAPHLHFARHLTVYVWGLEPADQPRHRDGVS